MHNPQDSTIRYIKGIGPRRAEQFAAYGIRTIEDLLYYFPRRYQDRTRTVEIFRLEEGASQTVKASVVSSRFRQSFRRRRFTIVEAAVRDGTGTLQCVWFNQRYLKDYFKPGQQLILFGKVERYAGRLQMGNPEFELLEPGEEEALSSGRFIPMYTIPQGMTQRYFRGLMKQALDEYAGRMIEIIPCDIRERNNLLNLDRSLACIHFPEDLDRQQEAFRRLSFEEFLLFQLPLVLRKARKRQQPGIAHRAEGALLDGFIAGLPFSLTASQREVLRQIQQDMAAQHPMQRLLQGDVGSGKTVVATAACVMAIQSGHQAALMVPTEILARQHYDKIVRQFAQLRWRGRPVRVEVLTGGVSAKDKQALIEAVASGAAQLVIGTHALLEEQLRFRSLGLVVIDEQHKFGVGQRALLPQKGPGPDVLIMTATPIPRTLAITLYGDMDISVISELPPGRSPVMTRHFNRDFKFQAYEMARQQIAQGNQVFIVYPVIEESYALDIDGAKKMFEEFKEGEFRGLRLGLIHGKLPQKEQEQIMKEFASGEIDLLVSTTVLEVGIDVPNATCMIIEHAERFGLSQLHQLRGRVGRGTRQSMCLLVSDTATPESQARIKAMVEHSSGFEIAQEDLKIRGPGEFFGRRQHGLTELRIGNPLTQMQLLKRAREEAVRLVNADPGLQMRQHLPLKERLVQRFPEYERLMLVG